MGKKDSRKYKEWKGRWEASPNWSYSLWSGAKSVRETGQRPWKSQGPHFPAYDEGWDRSQDLVEVKSTSTQPTVDSMVKHVQEAVNAVRKADSRVNKIQADQHAKEQCWTSYVQRMQQAFVVERKKHQAMAEKLAQDLVVAKEQQRLTREALTQAATGTAKAPPKQEPAADAEWLQLMTSAHNQATDAMEVDVDALGQQIAELLQPPAAPDGCPTFGMLPVAPTGETGQTLNLQEAFNRLAPGLGDALAAANAKTDSVEKPGGTRTATSHGHVSGVPSAGPLRTYNSASPRARVDPYQATSPGAGSPGYQGTWLPMSPPTAACPGEAPKASPTPPGIDVRETVKRACPPTDQTLAGKLAKARSHAMAPFRVGGLVPPRPPDAGGTDNPAGNVEQAVNLADGDTDDEELRQVASPGLGRLE
eukprot:s149_g6.t1